jgi:hypothetical protein
MKFGSGLAGGVIVGVALLAGCNPGQEPGTLHNARTNEQRAMYINAPAPLPAAKAAPAPSAPPVAQPAANDAASETEAQRLRRENEDLRRENERLKNQLNSK